MPFNFSKWDRRVQRDLDHRMSSFDENWRRNGDYVRNRYKGNLYGNLVRDFERVVYNRVVNRAGTVKVYADDSEYVEQAQELSIVANAVTRIAKLKENLRQATFLSTFSKGWLYVGHPFAAFGLDPRRYSPVITNVVDPSTMESQWGEVDPLTVEARGIDLAQISAFDMFEEEEYLTKTKPEPVFNDGGIGFPYIEYVNGLQMVTQREVSCFEDSDYVARLRVLTRKELEIMLDKDSKIDWDTLECMSYRYKYLFPDIDWDFVDRPYMIVECWVKRDRNNYDYNNYFTAWNFGQPEQVVRNRPNPWGGMLPPTPVNVSKMGNFLDRTLVDDMIRIAQMYSITLQSLERDMKESLNAKLLVGGGSQIEDDQAKLLLNPAYRGKVDVSGRPEDLKIHRGEGIDQNKILYARFLRELAQQTSNTSDIDRGQPIKKITARQTNALLEATDTVMGGMRDLVSEAAAEVVYKFLHILHIFHGEKQQYNYGGAIVKYDPGSTDFTTSPIYRVEVTELGPDATIEEAMVMIQSLRAMIPEIKQHLDWRVLTEEFAQKMRWPKDAVIQTAPMMPGLELPEIPEVGLDQRQPMEQSDSEEAPVPFQVMNPVR